MVLSATRWEGVKWCKAFGQVVGEGYHPRAGEPHAEVFALRGAGRGAEGATAYVTLEPCNHFGRTPPCSRALIDARVSRVCGRPTLYWTTTRVSAS